MATLDCIVIGGGLSGMAAAAKLHRAGVREFVVLEARDRVGGRMCTEHVPAAGCSTDAGGAYVGQTQDRLLRLAEETGVERYAVHSQGQNVLLLDGQRSTYSGAVPPLNPVSLLQVNRMMVALDERQLTVDPDKPWEGADAAQADRRTVQEWMNDFTSDTRAQAVTGLAVQALLNAEPHEVSQRFFEFYVRSGQGLARLIECTEGGAQQFKFVGGSAQIPERLVERVGEDKVRLNAAVCSVKSVQGGVVVTCRDGQTYSARSVIVALAPALYEAMGFSPALPALKRQLGQRMPMGSIIKTATFWPRAYWREQGFSGIVTSDMGPISASYDDCKPDGSAFAIMGFILARHARAWTEATYEERRDMVCQQYAVAFKCPEMRSCLAYHEKNWNEEEFSGGCYVGFMGPGVMSEFGKAIRQPVGAVHFAGTETATKWCGYMDGAIQAGERAGHEVLRYLGAAHPVSSSRFHVPSSAWVDDEPESRSLPVTPMATAVSPAERRLAHLTQWIVPVLAVLGAAMVGFAAPFLKSF